MGIRAYYNKNSPKGVSISEIYKKKGSILADMRHVVVIACLLLILAACSGGNEVTGKVLAVDGVKEAKTAPVDVSDTSVPVETDSSEDDEPKRPEQFAEVTEEKTYDVQGECRKDSKGVVRFFDESGKKTVYRNECVGNFIIEYACDGNQVVSENTVCNGVCTPGTYGATCE
ncbi:MAG: hypothetical protein ACE5FT_06355 [Candidatus Nanoarchaeia archaeon]